MSKLNKILSENLANRMDDVKKKPRTGDSVGIVTP